jgi:hypothetical protein
MNNNSNVDGKVESAIPAVLSRFENQAQAHAPSTVSGPLNTLIERRVEFEAQKGE